MNVETSDRVSSLASRYARYTVKQLADDCEEDAVELVRDIRSLAASALAQDRTKGLRGLIRRMVGK